MPKVGMEPVRRKALVDATLRAVGDRGSLTVTMSEIARHAGVSAALAHHYFGSKEQLVLETIRSLLRQLKTDTVAALNAAGTPREKLSAVIRVNFQAHQFAPETVAAWLAFYSEAPEFGRDATAAGALCAETAFEPDGQPESVVFGDDAARIAEGASAMIDGLYLRQGLKFAPVSIEASIALVEDYLTAHLASLTDKGE